MDRRATRKGRSLIELPDFVHLVRDVPAALPGLVARHGSNPVVVSDGVIAAAGVVTPVIECLGAEMVMVPSGEPVLSSVSALAESLRGRDVVVAVGGGSVLDTAKLAALLTEDPDGLEARLRSAAPFPLGIPVVAMPTTSGSGAEVTRTAIVSHHGRKTWAWDERLRPEAAVIAPLMTAGTPTNVARAAGLDAFTHAVEAATGGRRTQVYSALGFEAAATIASRLPAALSGEADARADMMIAATSAGIAIDHCGTGIGHAVGHALASVGALPHGLAVMLGLAAGLEWTLETGAVAYEGLAEALGVSLDGLGPRIDLMLQEVGFADAFASWVPPSLEALTDEMRSEDHRPMRENNARPIRDDDIPHVASLVLRWWSA